MGEVIRSKSVGPTVYRPSWIWWAVLTGVPLWTFALLAQGWHGDMASLGVTFLAAFVTAINVGCTLPLYLVEKRRLQQRGDRLTKLSWGTVHLE